MAEQESSRWKKTREKGFIRYIFTSFLMFGGLIFIGSYFISIFEENSIFPNWFYIITTVMGLTLFRVILWFINEAKFNRTSKNHS